MVAHVALHPFDNPIEMIAHEFEHILEQLDAINLAAAARRPNSGVHAIDPARSMFETRRAISVGLRVAEEMRREDDMAP